MTPSVFNASDEYTKLSSYMPSSSCSPCIFSFPLDICNCRTVTVPPDIYYFITKLLPERSCQFILFSSEFHAHSISLSRTFSLPQFVFHVRSRFFFSAIAAALLFGNFTLIIVSTSAYYSTLILNT